MSRNVNLFFPFANKAYRAALFMLATERMPVRPLIDDRELAAADVVR